MKTYPEVTNANYQQWDKFSDEEILKDIQDTEAEWHSSKQYLKQLQDVADHPNTPAHERRMLNIRIAAFESVNADRPRFVEFLRQLLAVRQHAKSEATTPAT